jgi:hypothetical protein
VDISFKDDVTVHLLLAVSFLVFVGFLYADYEVTPFEFAAFDAVCFNVHIDST